jgi:hypothetical protein
MMKVSYDGNGIAPELLERLQTTHANTGVGLAGMWERLDDLNGQMEIPNRIRLEPPYASVYRWLATRRRIALGWKTGLEVFAQHDSGRAGVGNRRFGKRFYRYATNRAFTISRLLNDGPNRRHQFLRGIRFDHVTAAADLESVPDCFEGVVLAQEEDLGSRSNVPYSPGCLKSAHTRHCNVQDNDVRLQFFSLCDSFRSVGHVAHYVKIRFGTKESANATPHDRVIVSHQNTAKIAYAAAHKSQRSSPLR